MTVQSVEGMLEYVFEFCFLVIGPVIVGFSDKSRLSYVKHRVKEEELVRRITKEDFGLVWFGQDSHEQVGSSSRGAENKKSIW